MKLMGPLGLLLAGGVAVVVVTSGASKKAKPEELRESARNAAKAAKSRDWTLASAEALASQSETTVRAVADEMTRLGQTDQAKRLVKAFEEWSDSHPVQKDVVREEVAAKKSSDAAKPSTRSARGSTSTRTTNPSAGSAKASTSTRTIKPAAGSAKVSPALKSKVAPRSKVAPPKPSEVEVLAQQSQAMLAKNKRYHEDTALVARFQSAAGISADGKYGSTAARAAETLIKSVPVNPYYWPATGTAKAVSEYRTYLTGLKLKYPSQVSVVDVRLRTLGA